MKKTRDRNIFFSLFVTLFYTVKNDGKRRKTLDNTTIAYNKTWGIDQMRKNAEKRELSRLSRVFDKIWEKKQKTKKNAPCTTTIVPSENKFSSVLTMLSHYLGAGWAKKTSFNLNTTHIVHAGSRLNRWKQHLYWNRKGPRI